MGRAFLVASWILGCGAAPTPRSEPDPDAGPAACDPDPFAAGCPCGLDDAPQACWEGDVAQMNVGACRTGTTTCSEGA